MRFIEFFIKKRAVTYSLALLLAILGIVSYRNIGVSALPNTKLGEITIVTNLPGATPAFMANAISTPIEQAIKSISGIDTIRSYSSIGESHIHITFKSNTNIEQALAKLRSAISLIHNKLPSNATTPVITDNQQSTANSAVYLGIYSKTATQLAVSQYVRLHVLNRLEDLAGVGDVLLMGEKQLAVRIWLDPIKMAKYKITVNTVLKILNTQNQYTTGGRVATQYKAYTLQVDTKPSSIKQLQNITLKVLRNDKVIRLENIAKIVIGQANNRDITRVNGYPGVVLQILTVKNANILQVAQQIKIEVKSIKQSMPAHLHITTLIDVAKFVKNSTNKLSEAIIEAIILVSLVVLLFLGSLRLFIIPVIIIPLCILSAFILLPLFGFDLNVMTLLAIVLAIGLVVDDAIVVLENIVRNLDLTKTVSEAAVMGTRKISIAIIAMTGTLVVVYSPIALIHGFVGNLVRPFAYTLASLVVLSGILSLTLTPALTVHMLERVAKNKQVKNKFTQAFEQFSHQYEIVLRKMLLHKRYFWISLVLFLLLGVFALFNIKVQLTPYEDYGGISAFVLPPKNSSPEFLQAQLQHLSDIFAKQKNIKSFFGRTYFDDGGESFYLNLKSYPARKESATKIIADLTKRLQNYTAANVYFSNFSLIDPSLDNKQISMAISMNASYRQLYAVTKKLIAAAKMLKGITDVRDDLNFNNQVLNLSVKRKLAQDMGVSLNSVASTVSTLYGSTQTDNGFNRNGELYPIYLELPASYRKNLAALHLILLKSVLFNKFVSLNTLVHAHYLVSPLALSHFNEMRSTMLKAELKPGYTMGQEMQKLGALAAKILPENARITWTNASRQYRTSQSNIMLLISLALIAIYLVLVMNFSSFIEPLIIMFTVPFSFIGAVIVLFVVGSSLNIYSELGLLTLIGLITKHGILIIDFTNILLQEGKSKEDAVILACKMRLRPILMTSTAMIAGAIPLILISGEAVADLNEIGWSLVGGLMFGTVCSLFIIPITYITFRGRRINSLDDVKDFAKS